MKNLMYSLEHLSRDYSLDTKLDTIVKDLEKQEWEKGHLICEIYVNGNYVQENDETNLKDFALSQLTFLEITTRSQNELIKSNLNTLYQWMPRISQSIKSIQTKLDKGTIQQEMQNILEIVEGCQWVLQSIIHLQSHLSELVNRKDFDHNVESYIQLLTNDVKQILIAIESNDKVLLKDLLDYELRLHLDEWHSLIFNQKEIQGFINL